MRERNLKHRRLTLARETVRSLGEDQLKRVGGGESAATEVCVYSDNDASCGPSWCWDCTVRGGFSNLRTCLC